MPRLLPGGFSENINTRLNHNYIYLVYECKELGLLIQNYEEKTDGVFLTTNIYNKLSNRKLKNNCNKKDRHACQIMY